MINFFKKKPHPKKKYIYAVTTGRFVGELLVYSDCTENEYCFLSLPLMKNRLIPKKEFDSGINHKIVDVVEKLPAKVYSVCAAQYAKNIKDSNIAEIE